MQYNTKKKKIENQNYEDYWKLTLGTSAFFNDQFIRTLSIIVKHIDDYKLNEKSDEELIKNLNASRKRVNEHIVNYKELEKKIQRVYPNDDKTGASTRKQINQYVKLGFVNPYLKGYNKGAAELIKPNKSIEELERIFSDTVYEHASFNSSVTNDDRGCNQIKFIVKTLLNRKEKVLNIDELIGIMQLKINGKEYAKEKEILVNKNWAVNIDFATRKYNQISYILRVLSKLQLFETVGSSGKKNINKFYISLSEHANEYLPKVNDQKRDNYRFALMKKAVHEESQKVYGKKICWFTKEQSEGLVVSHIYASNLALKNWDIDEAYDPNNAFLFKPGDVDQYFDKYKMTIDENGYAIPSKDVRSDFVDLIKENNYKIDSNILNSERKRYLEVHNKLFKEKYI
ncbi:hypothetical protein [Mammaliicoccus sciuri]|uniref:hypothetical protein n=1 Tax=Mammaliicoccus sciuri TaxID=1296 RepID=UPI001FB2DE2C|nr:hypothetical protein [Mammaliicoccus sciuri]MCJ1782333.1 hypothetical protein [Mammaliicoccus sciuri]